MIARILAALIALHLFGAWGFSTGTVPQAQLQVVATGSDFPNEAVNSSAVGGASITENMTRSPVVMGATFSGPIYFYLEANYWAGSGAVSALGNTLPYLGMCFESGALTQSVRVTFNASNSITLPSGAHMVRSDPVSPSAFGLSQWTRDDLYFIRTNTRLAAAGNWPTTVITQAGLSYGLRSIYYDPANRVDQVCSTGNLTGVSGQTTSNNIVVPSAIVGVAPGYYAVVANGDSWSYGVDDNAASIAAGQGIEARGAFANGATPSQTIPFIRLLRSGTGNTAQDSCAASLALDYFKFANVVFAEIGANDIGNGTSAAQTLLYLQCIWSRARVGGAQKIIQWKMNPRTSSTDNWVTAANQSYSSNFGPGSAAATLNTLVSAALSQGKIDAIMTSPSIRDPGDEWKWISNGTANFATLAGTHPNQNTYPIPFLGQDYRSVITSLRVNFLLKRDLDPAANDNAPAFLGKIV